MIYSIECLYCGKIWEESFYYKNSIEDVRCPVCKDKNVKTKQKKEDDRDPFGYNVKEKKHVLKT